VVINNYRCLGSKVSIVKHANLQKSDGLNITALQGPFNKKADP